MPQIPRFLEQPPLFLSEKSDPSLFGVGGVGGNIKYLNTLFIKGKRSSNYDEGVLFWMIDFEWLRTGDEWTKRLGLSFLEPAT